MIPYITQTKHCWILVVPWNGRAFALEKPQWSISRSKGKWDRLNREQLEKLAISADFLGKMRRHYSEGLGISTPGAVRKAERLDKLENKALDILRRYNYSRPK